MSVDQKEFKDTYTADGIHRQKSMCRIQIFSHVIDPSVTKDGYYDVSPDVIECQTSKTVKGGGGASFTLVPRVNYLNRIFANDYVNIYFNPGDGRGWIRTFFGFVDRVSRVVMTGKDGSTITRFRVVCSDFTKAFDYINIYFNPQISQRKDITGSLVGTGKVTGVNDLAGVNNLGGVALRTAGVTMHGSPVDVALSLMYFSVGFGAQFILPPSLSKILEKQVVTNRFNRLAWAKGKLNSQLREALESSPSKTMSGLTDYIDKETIDLATKSSGGVAPPANIKANDLPNYRAQVLKNLGIKEGHELSTQEALALLRAENLVNSTTFFLFDLIDIRHAEWRAVDGEIMTAAITEQTGTIWSLINAWSNSFLNEVFCDLRPMQDIKDSSDPTIPDVFTGGYSRRTDSLGGNVARDEENGICYEPCFIMREFPYSTIEDFNPPPAVQILKKNLAPMFFGAIFANDPNKPGRKVTWIPTLSRDFEHKNPGAKGYKHLDVAVITTKDIISEDLGRGDHDHYNLVEVYTEMETGKTAMGNIMMQDIIPITNPISIARHGLRPRKFTTKFGQYGQLVNSQDAAAGVLNIAARHRLARWSLLLDHWAQHSMEYLSGSLHTRAFPEIRVGYRLDISDRHESYYVDSVSHSWQYLNPMTSNFTVVRGQRNDPYPAYIMPASSGFAGERGVASRLSVAQYFYNAAAINNSLSLNTGNSGTDPRLPDEGITYSGSGNYVDKLHPLNWLKWPNNPQGYASAGSSGLRERFIDTTQGGVSLENLENGQLHEMSPEEAFLEDLPYRYGLNK
jgi:hypothetical protein